ncbi:MAG TPA: Rieske (2Fe-2S) protein [Bacteroidales bacterium]|nr:Rieske (2Fe-2S) protein [Bacteroidales bacterium]HRX96118.1 Rieske (2Fe-2S) protein [Bacteroidales bacterium]
MAELKRRTFIKKLWTILGIIAGAELLVTFSGFFGAKRKPLFDDSQHLIDAGKVSSFQLNSVFPFRSGKFYLVRLSDGGFMALSLKCTHLGCSVMWNEAKKEFLCPCHASSFDQFGEVINPPAPRALDSYPVIIREGKVLVDISKSVHRNKFENSQVTYA